MAKRRYYPSTPKDRQSNDWNRVEAEQTLPLDLTPLNRFGDEKIFKDWANKFQDEWINRVASINDNNSIAQYNEYILNRLSYVECSHLAIDPIINNAISKFANGMVRKGGEIS